MSSAKPDANAASIEAARAARRELHEEIQAARDALRELRAGLAGFATLAAVTAARAQDALDATEARVNTEIEELTCHITAENAKVLAAIAQYLACDSPAALLSHICDSVSNSLKPVLSDQLDKDMPDVIREYLDDVRTEANLRIDKARASVREAPRWQNYSVLTDNGALGAVPRPDGH